MKPRSEGFLWDGAISHDSEQFDYIREIHDYLWRFVRTIKPGAIGYLSDYLDGAIELAESRLGEPVQTGGSVDIEFLKSVQQTAATDEAVCLQSALSLLMQRRLVAKSLVDTCGNGAFYKSVELYESINQKIRLVMGL